ncbi:MAG: twin-arginine translocation signal domain-containing protein [Candidatus Portnoybacteria bacterium]|nr:twin-arginine translocation signal domain-containing protein [Candidatus Portnoybacteria bacterium]
MLVHITMSEQMPRRKFIKRTAAGAVAIGIAPDGQEFSRNYQRQIFSNHQ